jgi:hypothetical protein
MAVDEWTLEYHLTPGGWVKGTETYFRDVSSEVPRPEDAVETWKAEGYQKSGWGREEALHRCIWHDSSKSEAEREGLRSRFQSPFLPYSRLKSEAATS